VVLTELANHSRALIAAAGLQRFSGWRVRLESLREMMAFLIFVVFLGPAVGALAGAAVVVSHDPGQRFWVVWQAWALSNAITGLVLPVLMLDGPRAEGGAPLGRGCLVEGLLLLTGLVATGLGVFMVPFQASAFNPARLYWPVPFLLWAAARFGPRGTSAALVGVTAMSIWGALNHLGPFAGPPTGNHLLDLQLFLLAISVPFLLFSAVVGEQRRSAVELGESRRRDEFLAMAGHELRNPLAPMALALEIMRQAPATTDAGTTWALGALDRQLRQLTRLVDDLLDIPRMTTGRIRLRLEPVELSSVVVQAVETTRPQLDSAGHQLAVSIADGLPRLRADAARLTQVLSNLLGNAARYTEPGGRIELTAGVEGGGVRIAVRDNGMGIPAEALPTIFDLYYQAPAARGLPGGGLGIGLTLARTLVELHGGSIEARSGGTGQGSEFVVNLPFPASLAESAAAPASASPATAGSLRILAVDDNVDVTDGLAQVLATWGHTVRTAHDGVDALEVAVSFAPQVVLLDLQLPRLDGVEVARRLRAARSVPALFVSISGSGPERTSLPGGQTNFHHHLVKPIDMIHLRALLDSVARDPRPRVEPGAEACDQRPV
jgi:signal transduction histidine kinase/CheY-like chemotaxis protein